MGSTVSIINKTNLVLNIALLQLSPLYFENGVPPNGTMTRRVGKVWFGIQAKWDLFENRYSDGQNVAVISTTSIAAILGAITAGVAFAPGAAAGAAAAGTSSAMAIKASAVTTRTLAGVGIRGALAGKVASGTLGTVVGGTGALVGNVVRFRHIIHMGASAFTAASASQIMDAVNDWGRSAVVVHGWYLGRDRTFEIRGGPRMKRFQLENGTIVELVDLQDYEPFSIHEIR